MIKAHSLKTIGAQDLIIALIQCINLFQDMQLRYSLEINAQLYTCYLLIVSAQTK